MNDPDMAEMAKNELTKLEEQKKLLLKSLENHNKDSAGDIVNTKKAILEIRGAAGGEEAKIWGSDLLRMYLRFCEIKGWKIEMLSESSFQIKGKNYYKILIRIRSSPCPKSPNYRKKRAYSHFYCYCRCFTHHS